MVTIKQVHLTGTSFYKLGITDFFCRHLILKKKMENLPILAKQIENFAAEELISYNLTPAWT